jgi:hypothetical protein
MDRFPYRDPDRAFGQAMLTLRDGIGLTQAALPRILESPGAQWGIGKPATNTRTPNTSRSLSPWPSSEGSLPRAVNPTIFAPFGELPTGECRLTKRGSLQFCARGRLLLHSLASKSTPGRLAL